MDKQLTPTDARAKLWDLIKDIRFAMFTTRHGKGHLHSRPMTTLNSMNEEDSSLWFFASRSSAPVADIGRDTSVHLSYADPGKDCYVSFCGSAALAEDIARKKHFWITLAQAWLDGPDDPELALVRVDIDHAEFWDVNSNKMVQLYQMAKAAVTGQPPQDLGEHAQVQMR